MGGMNMREAAGKSKKSAKKEVEHIRVAAAENGGHTAYTHHKSFDHPPEGPHIFPAGGEKHPVIEGSLFHHLAKHLGIPHEVVGKEEPGEEMEEHEMAEAG